MAKRERAGVVCGVCEGGRYVCSKCKHPIGDTCQLICGCPYSGGRQPAPARCRKCGGTGIDQDQTPAPKPAAKKKAKKPAKKKGRK
jgi:hypothetical protein